MFFLPLLLLLQNLKGLASGKELKRSGQSICKFPIYRIRKDPGNYSEISWSGGEKSVFLCGILHCTEMCKNGFHLII
jgi:hypothetical protein